MLRQAPPKDTIRLWVKDTKREIRQSQQAAVAAVAQAEGKQIEEGQQRSPFADLVAQLRLLGQPATPADLAAVEELVSVAKQLLAPGRRRRSHTSAIIPVTAA